MRASMALNRNAQNQQRRQAIFLRKTGPRAARPGNPAVAWPVDRPVVGVVNGLPRCTALQPHCRRQGRAVASHHEGEWRCTSPRSKEGRAPVEIGVRIGSNGRFRGRSVSLRTKSASAGHKSPSVGKRELMIPGYKTVSMRDLVYQPGAKT